MRVDITTPATPAPYDFALSPDGRSIAFVARAEGQTRLWVRALDHGEAQPLPGTEDAAMPFWSADSRCRAPSLLKLNIGGHSVAWLCAR
jgi:hypothetical protein